MITNKAIEEVGCWVMAAREGHREEAKNHVQTLYHLGASFTASNEFQTFWQEEHGERLAPPVLDHFCKFLNAIAELEASELQAEGHAKA